MALLGSIVLLRNAVYTVHTYIHTYIGLVGIGEFVGATVSKKIMYILDDECIHTYIHTFKCLRLYS